MATGEAVQSGVVAGNEKPAGRGLRVGLWIAQALLAVGFAMAGLSKLTQPIAEMAKSMPFVATTPEALVRFIGLSEVAGALGLILPAVTRIKPVLTAWAGVGLTTVMVLAAAFHISRGEAQMLPAPVVLGALAAFVAWGRFGKARIVARQ